MLAQIADLAPRGAFVWNGIHRDARNSDFSPVEVSSDLTFAWSALDGAAVLFGPSIGPDRNRYVATGQGDGSPHLHCFSPDGQLLARSDPEAGQPGARVAPDVPLFDDVGRLFVSDKSSTWCFGARFERLWRTDFSAFGVDGGFISTVLTRSGLVGGIAMDGKVVLLDRQSGELAIDILQLPVGKPFPAPPRMPGLWQNGMMSAALVAEVEPGFFGYGSAVTCSPAISPSTGRIFIPFSDAANGRSRLAAIDEGQGSISLAWLSDLEGVCTSSPAISPDGRRIHTVNGRGIMHAFDCASGELLWMRDGCGMAASPTLDASGNVYSAGRDSVSGVSQLLAIDGQSGDVLWRTTFEGLAREALPDRAIVPGFPNPSPTGVANSVPTVTPGHVLLVVNLGYDFAPPGGGPRLHQPHIPVLVVLDRDNGTVLSTNRLRDTSEAVIVVGDDHRLHVCHAALVSSMFHFGINPHLPESHRSPLVPVGGFSTFSW
ncbi:outer membrane protein assembly factor BamB family protein [Qipengyuania flava]|uniref:outer membrane protein assembly factor BamB family protein n=1 Tax=Qipengyuania flava TaxID=192812 RepID=UPI00273D38EE|nr:PQQ-binding-like beta-propeller repeat protein [Qipengyuania flava]